MRHSSWLRSLVFGIGFSLAFMSVYDCAYVGTQFEGSFIGWASYQGLRLLQLPGNHLFVLLFGLEEIYNTDPNLLIPFRIGFPVMSMLVLGMIVGFLWRPVSPVEPSVDQDGSFAYQSRAVLVLSLAGMVGFGFVLGLLAFVLGAMVLGQLSPAAGTDRVRVWLGIVIGAFDVVAWTLGLAIQLAV